MVSKDYVICPHCKKNHSKNKAMGATGLVNYCGSEFSFTCDKCGKDIYGTMEVIVFPKTFDIFNRFLEIDKFRRSA